MPPNFVAPKVIDRKLVVQIDHSDIAKDTVELSNAIVMYVMGKPQITCT